MDTVISSTSLGSRVDDQTAKPERPKKELALYLPGLDMLRFFAFLMIFYEHLDQINVNGGTFGTHHPHLARLLWEFGEPGKAALPVFYVLSSFLVTSLLLKEREQTGRVHLWAFYVRRMLRLWPLYLTSLFGLYALGHFWAPAVMPTKYVIYCLLFIGNFVFMSPGLTVGNPGWALWSISLEEQFYLVWPVMLTRLSRKAIAWWGWAFIALSLLSNAWSAHHYIFWRLRFFTPSNIVFFGLGILLGLHYGLAKQKSSIGKFLLGLVVALPGYVLFNMIAANETVSAPGAVAAYAGLGLFTAAVVWAFIHIPTKLVHPKLAYLGRISFGLYIFHQLVLSAARIYLAKMPFHTWAIPAFVITLVLAVLSYEYFEKPFLKLKYRFEFVHPRKA